MSDVKGWVEVYRSTDQFNVNVLHARLGELGIESVIFNHQDSAWKMLNDNLAVSLLVHPEQAESALEIVKQQEGGE